MALQEKLAARVDQEDNEEDDIKAQEAQDMLEDLIQSKEKNNGNHSCSQLEHVSGWFALDFQK